MDADLHAQPTAWKLQQVMARLRGQAVRILRKAGHGGVQVDDERADPGRRILGRCRTGNEQPERIAIEHTTRRRCA